MNLYTTYTVRSKNSTNVWQFKYHLNGTLAAFEILEGMFDQAQIEWFFIKGRFPYLEDHVKHWKLKLQKNFEIEVGEPDLSFDHAWLVYDYRVGKKEAKSAFDRLTKAKKILFFMSLPAYKKFLGRKGTAQLYMSSYINGERYNDEFHKIK